jgi:putative redox protein
MQVITQWQEKQKFTATTEQGDTIVMDGNDSAPSPMQLILAAIGGCSSIDVVMILEKGRQQITDCRCTVTAQRADTVPAVFTKINAHYVVSGKDLKESSVQRACQLSIEKYCSVALMLNQSVDIAFTFELTK